MCKGLKCFSISKDENRMGTYNWNNSLAPCESGRLGNHCEEGGWSRVEGCGKVLEQNKRGSV